MPLINKKSQKAFEHNLKAELHAGKPKDQSLAVAYSVQRKPKKMSKGGQITPGDTRGESSIPSSPMSPKEDKIQADSHDRMYAEGGMIDANDKRGTSSEPRMSVSTHEAQSIAEAIMHANKMKMEFEDQNDTESTSIRPGYAQGGEVDLDTNEEEQPNGYYKRNEHDSLNEDFDSAMDGLYEPEDSNEKDPGDELLEESDEHDMVGKIMKKNKKK